MAMAQRNNWNVSNAEVSSTKPSLSSSWEVQIQAAAAHRAQPQCTFQCGMPAASLLRAMIYISATLSASCTLSGATRHRKLLVLKLIIKASAIEVAANFMIGQFWYFLVWISDKPSARKCWWSHWHRGCLAEVKTVCRWWFWAQQHRVCHSLTAALTCDRYCVGGWHLPPSGSTLHFEEHVEWRDGKENTFLWCKLVMRKYTYREFNWLLLLV